MPCHLSSATKILAEARELSRFSEAGSCEEISELGLGFRSQPGRERLYLTRARSL
jgi:hypothetical protein